MNSATPRVFIAATRQKRRQRPPHPSASSAALQKTFSRASATSRPVGQRLRRNRGAEKSTRNTVLMDSVYQLDCPLVGHEPHRRGTGFHAEISAGGQQRGARQKKSRKPSTASRGKRILSCCEGSGARGRRLGVLTCPNAQVAKILGRESHHRLARGGIGKPIDEVLFEPGAVLKRKGSRSSGSSSTKSSAKRWTTSPIFARRGAQAQKAWNCSACCLYEQILCNPSVDLIREELQAGKC